MTIAARPEEPAPAPMMLSAASDVNPDATGRPSPIVVRVYQLRADAAFAAADFFALFDEEQQTLGAGLISRDEFVLRPADARNVDVSIAGETRFVGVVAAYRDIRNAEWRGLLPTPRRGFTVTLERARVRVSAVPD
jgi:type VI secretion system protein VasD